MAQTMESGYGNEPFGQSVDPHMEKVSDRRSNLQKWEEEFRRYKDQLRNKKQIREQMRASGQLGGQPSSQLGGQPSSQLGGQPSSQLGGQPSSQLGGQPSTQLEGQTGPSLGGIQVQKPIQGGGLGTDIGSKAIPTEYVEKEPLRRTFEQPISKVSEPTYFGQSVQQPTGYERPTGYYQQKSPRGLDSSLQAKEWVPMIEKHFIQTPVFEFESPKSFPVNPDDYFPRFGEELTYSLEDEAELLQRVGVKCGIHLQALTRDLNRLASLVEGPVLRPYRRESIFSLMDILDDVKDMDFKLKQVLSNLYRDMKDRGVTLKELLNQEEEDERREEEALRRRKPDLEVRERVITSKKTPETIKEIPKPTPIQQIQKPLQEIQRPSVVQQPLPTSKIEEGTPKEIITEDVFTSEPHKEKWKHKEKRVTTPTGQATTPLAQTTTPPAVVETTTPIQETGMQTTEQPQKSSFQPFFEVQENPNSIILTSVIPGLNKEDIHLKVGKEHFTIEGLKRETGALGESPLSFSETYRMPKDVNTNEVKATYDNNTLSIVCPKQSPVQAAF